MLLTSFCCYIVNSDTIVTHPFGVSIVDFKQENVTWKLQDLRAKFFSFIVQLCKNLATILILSVTTNDIV